MTDIEIKSLKNTSFDELFEAFRQAFAEYEMQLNRAELQAMLKRRGFDPEFSFAAFFKDLILISTILFIINTFCKEIQNRGTSLFY